MSMKLRQSFQFRIDFHSPAAIDSDRNMPNLKRSIAVSYLMRWVLGPNSFLRTISRNSSDERIGAAQS
jgi:hypothetical protein